jgi:hypothetical protein
MTRAISNATTTAFDSMTPATAISRTAARLSLAAATVFLVLLGALHFIKPEFDPSWRMVSEYAIGDNGWVMSLAFLFLAVSCVTSFVALQPHVHTIGGHVGLTLLLVVAGAMTAAGVFAVDPITASQNELTTHGALHGLASLVGIPGFPIAAVLITLSLAGTGAWSSARRSLLWTAHLTWISVLLMIVALAVMLPQRSGFGPDVLIGWPNRLVVLSYCFWLITVGWRAGQLRRPAS